MVCISSTSKLPMRLVVTLGLITTLLLSPALVAAQEPQSDQDLLAPSAFAVVEELTSSGKAISIRPERQDVIIDKGSRLRVRFRKEIIAAGINLEAAQQKWQQLLQSEEYQARKDKLAQTVDDALRNQLQKLITATEEQVLLEIPGYAISIAASVLPKQGHPFDLEVEGYTTVKTEETASSDNAPEKRTVITTMERRLYRVDAQLRIDKPSEPGALVIRNDVPEAFIDLPEQELAEGDRIEVTVTNHSGTPPRSFHWQMEVRQLGVRTKQDPTLLLVKRFKSLDTLMNVENNFKPAPGSSFLFKFPTRNRTWNFIDPSIGINASFLDFRSDKELEIGVGPVLSIFNGIFQVNVGWHLNVDSDRGYWSLGLGFLDIAGKVKELTKN